jgi:hypothetical protein
MTVAPYAPARTRLLVALLAAAFCLVLGVAVLRELGAGASLVPFALAAVGLVDAAMTARRTARD